MTASIADNASSAGFVLAATFAVLATLPLVFVAEMGTAVALGVILDTMIVRSVLVTALNLDLGGKIWWPSKLDREDAPLTRDQLIVRLRESGIGTSVHFKGIHMLTHYSRRCGVGDEDLPASTDWARRTISLPLHPGLSDVDHETVIDAVTDLLTG